jgi:transcription antitermination protein NusB
MSPAPDPEQKTEPKAKGKSRKSGAPRQSAARLAAVQALYQIELSGDSADEVVLQFLENRREGEIDAPEGDEAVPPKTELMTEIVRGVHGRLAELDDILGSALSEDWSVARVEHVLRCIMRAGVYELTARAHVPARVVINEYVELAQAFYGGSEPGMVNGVLDKLARGLRPTEFGGGAAGTVADDRSPAAK